MERFETFSTLIAKINKNVRKIKSAEMSSYNLRSTHVQYIYHLYREKALSLKQLSNLCIADKASVSRAVEELQSLGLIKADNKKQYKISYSLTEDGERIGESLFQRIDTIIGRAGRGLSEEERADIYKMLALISENLQKIVDSIG